MVISPENAENANALGLAHLSLGNAIAASASFEEAVRLRPHDSTYLINLGRSYVENDLFSKALFCLDRALSISPNSAEAHASMAILCKKTGDRKGAREHAFAALSERSRSQADLEKMRGLLDVLVDEDK